jgi:hypothetical protein
MKIRIASVIPKTSSKGKPYKSVKDDQGNWYGVWAQELQDKFFAGSEVDVVIKREQAKDGSGREYMSIQGITPPAQPPSLSKEDAKPSIEAQTSVKAATELTVALIASGKLASVEDIGESLRVLSWDAYNQVQALKKGPRASPVSDFDPDAQD